MNRRIRIGWWPFIRCSNTTDHLASDMPQQFEYLLSDVLLRRGGVDILTIHEVSPLSKVWCTKKAPRLKARGC